MKKRVFALLLCLVLCLSILPVGAFADDYCEHDIAKMEAKATCGEAHREHYKCTKCGKLFSDERGENEITYESVTQAKPVHTSDLSHVDYKDASCTESGSYEYWYCTECGQMFSENPGVAEDGTDNRRTKPVPDDKVRDYTIEPYGHNLTFHEAVPHTCTQDGNVAYYQCSNCWWSFSDPEGQNPLSDVTDPAAHVKTEYPAVAPTCDTDGRSYYFYCDVCGKYYNEFGQEIEEGSWVIPAGHNYVEQPFREPTCTAGGNRLYYTCSGCDKVFDADLNETTLEAVTLNMIPHSLVIHVPAAAKSCYLDGNVEYWQCASCGAKFADAEGTLPLTDEEVVIPACHEFVATPAKEATCTEPGNIAYWTCSVEGCGIVVDESGTQVWETAVPAAGHKPVKVERSTTCTEAGVAEHYKCEACGRLFQDEACTVETALDQLQEAALGHEFDWEGWCTRCKAVSPDAPAFNPGPVTVPNNDNTYVVVTVTAPEGVFPANCQLSVQPVFVVDDQTKEAVDAERQEGKTVAKSFTYDIKVLKNGEEIQPADGSKVKVSFALATAANENLDATVYHVTEAEDGSKSAKALETSVEGESVSAETDGFSLYTVEFTYQELQYVLPGGETVSLATVLETLGLSGNVQTVTVSNPALFEAKNEMSGWTVYSYQPFQTEEWMKVTLDWIEYTIKVTDDEFYKVTFDMKGYGEQEPEQTVVKGGYAETPKRYKTVVGDLFLFDWCSDSDCKNSFLFDETPITDNITIYAKWRCRVRYITEHGTVDNPSAAIVVGSRANNKTPTSVAGYTFDKWYSENTFETPFDFSTKVEKNIDLYAKWNPDFRIIEGDGGTAHHGSTYAFTLNYAYADYNKNKDKFIVSVAKKDGGAGSTLTEGTDYIVSQDSEKRVVVTLKEAYIKTLEDATTYNITFDTGLEDLSSTTGTFKVSKDPITTWTVTFEMNGHGTAPAAQLVEDGDYAKRPTDPTATGYVFDNWYNKNGKVFDFKTPITADTTIYAKWRCEVTFVTDHGTAPTTQPVDIGGTAKDPGKLSWIGYNWGGWTDEAGNAFDFKTPITKNRALYARWIPDLKITKGDGGTAHYGSTYPFTLNYYFPDYNSNKDLFKVYVARSGSSYALLDRDHYAVTYDSDKRVVVTLKASYIRTLADGATYYILFDTGLPDPPTDLGETEGTFKVSKSPKTGDESNVALWAAIAGVSLIVVIVIAVVLLNKRKKGKKAPTPPENRPADKTRKPPKE